MNRNLLKTPTGQPRLSKNWHIACDFSEESESSLHKRRRLRNCEKGMEFLTCDGCEDYYYISIFKLSFPMTKVSGPSNTFSINALLRNLALKHFSVWPNQYLHPIAFHSAATTTNKLMAQPWVIKWDSATPIFSQVLSYTNFSVNTTAPNLNSTAATLTTASALLVYQKGVKSIYNRRQFLSSGS